jgi:hypothetical protein
MPEMYWWEWVHYGFTLVAVCVWIALCTIRIVEEVQKSRRRRRTEKSATEEALAQLRDMRYERDVALLAKKDAERIVKAHLKSLESRPNLGRVSP